jgi:hypothetical protein
LNKEDVSPLYGHFLVVIVISLSILSTSLSLAQNSQSQTNYLKNPFIYNCVQPPGHDMIYLTSNKGLLKPSVTDVDAPVDAYFPVLIVFVQFANDPGPQVDWWPKGSPPQYINQLLARTKKYPVNGNWWDTYSEDTELLSDYWLEQSRGHLHVLGEAVSVVLDHDYVYYQTHGGVSKVNDDIYQKLKDLGTINWRNYDKWKIQYNPGELKISYEPDGYIDMVYKVHRSHAPGLGMPAGGLACLGLSDAQGVDYLIDPVNNIYINGDFYYSGSGVTLSPGFGGDEFGTDYFPYGPLTKYGMASFSEHEHGHYLFGSDHSNYGKMSGSGAPYGVDECLSPWESVYLNYITPHITDYNIYNYELGDFSSRNSNDTGEVLEVPIHNTAYKEFFLIANRTKVSSYDRIMWGDTAHGDPYRVINPEYGKGVYIYHTPIGDVYPTIMDQECADGLFSWSFAGDVHPDWSNEQLVGYYVRTSVSYNNDASDGSMNCADGKSMLSWFGIGQKHSCIGCDGTDRLFTNKSEVWTSRELQGDRWDAWNVGYNEVFSPYSSPSTKDWKQDNTGIFIWLYNSNPLTNTVSLKIFRAGYGSFTEDSILALTPPSRPTGLKADLTDCSNNIKYPILIWNHNKEPDMINSSVPTFTGKTYRIYKAVSASILTVPTDYKLIASVNTDAGSLPQFIDYEQPISCNDTMTEVFRYAVTAVDSRGWESVKSDFVSILEDNSNLIQNSNNLLPAAAELKQNYPNPFNPETEIRFAVSFDGPVKITIYNILGESVKVLTDGYRKAGSYSVKFDASNLASGVYFYRLEAPNFIQTKKMVLLK